MHKENFVERIDGMRSFILYPWEYFNHVCDRMCENSPSCEMSHVLFVLEFVFSYMHVYVKLYKYIKCMAINMCLFITMVI